MGHIKFVTALMMTSLFALALILWVTNFGVDNNSQISLLNDDDFSELNTSLYSNSTQFYEDANSSSNYFMQSSLVSGDEATTTGQQFKVTVSSPLKSVTSVIKISWQKLFGRDTGFGIFLTVLLSILAYIGVAYGYKAWIGRDPD